MKIGKIELTKERLIMAALVTAVLVVSGVFLVFYVPLISGLKLKYSECKSMENEVLEGRGIIESVEKPGGGRELISEEAVPVAIGELTQHGKMQGINFISITPGEIKSEGSKYRILPIEMKIESTYGKLGVFLGTLDDLKNALVKVKSFDITPGRQDPSKRTVDLILELYFSAKKA